MQGQQIFLANQRWKMPTDLMRTKYLKHLDPESNLQVHFHLDQQLELLHLVHTKQEFGVPTKVGERYTNRACYLPTRNIEVQALLVQSLLHRCAQHQRMLWQEVQLLQTIALKDVVQQLYRNVSNVQLREYMDAFQQQRDPFLLVLQQQQRGHRSDPCHRIQFQCQPLRRARS